MPLTMIQTTCQACGQLVGIVSAPEPGEDSTIRELTLSATPDPVVGPGEDCPRCGAALSEDDYARGRVLVIHVARSNE